MTDFRISLLQNSSILYVYTERDFIQTDPAYQRQSDVWPLEKRQLLIDSILNEFDVPKLYFHEFLSTKKIDGRVCKYAIIDGKQRLQAIWDFIEGKFTLSEGFQYLHDSKINAAGLSYSELGQRYPKLKIRFDSTSLSIVSIQTSDVELIEDMFSRLNEAVPLNAAEKRNALGGPLPPAIRALVKEKFFMESLPFSNTRYRHFDLAAKFLYLEHKTRVADTKKAYLDQFVVDFRQKKQAEVDDLVSRTRATLQRMSAVFVKSDRLLQSVGMVLVYYLLFSDAVKNTWANKFSRRDLEEFEKVRKENRETAEQDITQARYDFLEFDRYAQSPNDAVAILYRYTVLRKYLGQELPDEEVGESLKELA